jgi:hypothetical protein
MKIRIRKDRIEFWKKETPVKFNKFPVWHVWDLYFNPVTQLREFIKCEINDFLLSKLYLFELKKDPLVRKQTKGYKTTYSTRGKIMIKL